MAATAKANPPEIVEIDQLARMYADAQTDLDALTNELKSEIDRAVRARWSELRRATTRAAERYEALLASVADARGAFERPKTRILHGVRVGFMKSKDQVQVLNAENTCALIKRLFPEQQDVLIATEERPVMAGIEQLGNDELKAIGCRRVVGGDAPFAKMAETELDKVVAALMKGAIERAEASS